MEKGILRQLSLFAGAADDALQELIDKAPSHTRTYEVGDIIALQGQRVKSLLVIISGAVKAQMTSSEGKRLTIDNITAPDLLASAFVYSTDNRFPVTIEAVENCTIWHLDKEFFLGYMSRHTSVMKGFLGIISDRCSFLSQKVNALSLQSLRERLIGYLHLHHTVGKQEELALLLGVTRPALARLLAELVEEGVLVKERQNYRLKHTATNN